MNMKTEGVYASSTIEQAQEQYESLGSTAQVVVKETAKAMDLSTEEYDKQVTSDVIETARDALFASLLEVTHSSRDEFESWRADHPETTVELLGNDNVDRVVWQHTPFADTTVAATYQTEPDAAAATIRRHAFSELYKPHL
jgi:hypothetical protein